mmetsp:Transcript_4645/g.16346  ORF Transcript_4645/g.16346 Transcript_4645/m.16346 type:complete len:472 (+) Transcript_4645:14-1429(+)
MAAPAVKAHDVGTDNMTEERMVAEGAIDKAPIQYEYWEQQIDAAECLLVAKGILNTHQLRNGVESLEEAQYNALSYYERWGISLAKQCLHSGALTLEEFQESFGVPLDSREEPRFQVGDRVAIKHEDQATRWLKPHLRTPGYLFGKRGVVQRYLGAFGNPEELAYAAAGLPGVGRGTKCPLYRVTVRQSDIWSKYDGHEDDTLEVEIYEHWLVPEDEALPSPDEGGEECDDRYIDPREAHEQLHEKGIAHGHGHSHDGDEEHDHVHEARVIVEKNAVEKEGQARPAQRLCEALVKALIGKGIFTAQELQERIEKTQMAGVSSMGARLVAHCWADEEFKKKLVQDGRHMMAFLGLESLNNEMIVVENTPAVHNVLVCTLCSCYPRQLLGLPPGWYKSRSYRERVCKFPRAVLRDFGVDLPSSTAIRVHDSNADMRYIVIPARPSGTEGWSEEQLAAIITRDAMVGVALVPPQ